MLTRLFVCSSLLHPSSAASHENPDDAVHSLFSQIELRQNMFLKKWRIEGLYQFTAKTE